MRENQKVRYDFSLSELKNELTKKKGSIITERENPKIVKPKIKINLEYSGWFSLNDNIAKLLAYINPINV